MGVNDLEPYPRTVAFENLQLWLPSGQTWANLFACFLSLWSWCPCTSPLCGVMRTLESLEIRLYWQLVFKHGTWMINSRLPQLHPKSEFRNTGWNSMCKTDHLSTIFFSLPDIASLVLSRAGWPSATICDPSSLPALCKDWYLGQRQSGFESEHSSHVQVD